jgi:hypothetical protein
LSVRHLDKSARMIHNILEFHCILTRREL